MCERQPYMRASNDPPKIPSDAVVIYCPLCKEPIDPREESRGGLYCCPECGTWFTIDSFGEKKPKDWSEQMAKDNDTHAWRRDRLFEVSNGQEPTHFADHVLEHVLDTCMTDKANRGKEEKAGVADGQYLDEDESKKE